MVSDQEIANCVESILRQCPPDPTLTTTTSSTSSTPAINVTGVVQQLEAKLGLDLSHKAGFIRDHISLLLRPTPKDHFALQQQQQQQQQQFLQQQYLGGAYLQHQMMQQQQQHQIQQSPFTHLPHQHELTFRCAPPVQMQRQQQQAAAAAAAVATSVMQKQEGNALAFAPGSSGPVAPAKGSGQSGKRRGGPGGLNKVCGVSPELQAIVGEPTMARTQIVKQLWAYIRKNNLQDPNNKRKIICNDELRLVFETDCTDMFKMNKLLAKHIIPLEPAKPGPDTKKIKTADAVSVIEPVTANQSVTLSDTLAEFFGTGETQMLQSEALKRIWDYIKVNQLEDPLNSMVIQFDAKLQQLFGCESLSAIGVSEMLSRHLFKQS